MQVFLSEFFPPSNKINWSYLDHMLLFTANHEYGIMYIIAVNDNDFIYSIQKK